MFPPSTTPNDTTFKTRGHILIVEDDVMVAAILQSRLKKMGYDAPFIAASGEKALEKVQKNRPVLVLMDISLSGKMDGIETAQCLRSQFDIPVVYLTSHSDEHTLDRASRTGPFGYIVKPFEEGELRATLEIALCRHQTEQRLRKMERWLATTLRSIGDGVIATDTEGRITMLNPVAEAITGWTQQEALGRPFAEVFQAVHQKTGQPIVNPVLRAIEEGIVINLEAETTLMARNKREICIDDSAAPIRDEDNKIIGVVVVFRDSSERRKAETAARRASEQLEERVKQRTAQLEAANRELEAFTYSVSHDLRAPIRTISGFADVLVQDYGHVLDAQGKRFLGLLYDNAQRMDKMVKDFLRLSQFGHSPLTMEMTDMTALVKEAVAGLSLHPKQAPPQIEVAALPSIGCDAALLRQVWENLLSNAVKYTGRQTSPCIRIAGVIKGKEAVYSIEDNGVGFDMAQASKLFGVFQRLHPANEFEGSGVGLSIVQRIILRHGGRVWATAEVNKGATFYFSLPVEAA